MTRASQMNVVEPILFQCKLNPVALAICVPGSEYGPINYGTLERFIHNAARTALKSGIAPGSLAATYITDTILHISLTLALMHVGVTTLSLRGPKMVPGISPDVVLTDAPGKISGGVTVLGVDRSWLENDGAAATDLNASRNVDDLPCRVILTSGSTGVSKGVAFSHRALAARMVHYTYYRGPRFAHCSRFFCDLGLATSPGFTYAMSLLSRGGTIYFLGREPSDMLQVIDLHRVQGMATSPYGLAEFLKFFEADPAFEVTFSHIICQGAMLSRELSHRTRARMCQNLYSSYGSTETSTVAFGPSSVLEKVPGAVGYVQPGAIIEALDGSGKILPALHDGVLRIRNDHMAAGYVGDAEATQSYFRDGYFYTGDIGHLTPEGVLVITGREKTALNIGGDTVLPEVVEEVITSFPAVSEAGVFASTNELGVSELSALVVTTGSIDLDALRSHCARRLSPSCVPVQFVLVNALPRGGQGKLERNRLPEMAAVKA
jgi:acyl-coenzyme A synthetase/AMP-(fatty) acid ligase